MCLYAALKQDLECRLDTPPDLTKARSYMVIILDVFIEDHAEHTVLIIFNYEVDVAVRATTVAGYTTKHCIIISSVY
jgi:hypothetical protein